MKTYDFNPRIGGLLDRQSFTAPTIHRASIGATLKKSELGLCYWNNGEASYLDTNVNSDNAVGVNSAIEVWFKPHSNSGTQYLAMAQRAAGSSYMSVLYRTGVIKCYYADDAGSVDSTSISSKYLLTSK